MKELCGASVKLLEGGLLRREQANRAYLMKLRTDHLLRNYELEAGRYTGRGHDSEAFDGWEDPSCQMRGHFLGHWLSAAALRYQETGDRELQAKAAIYGLQGEAVAPVAAAFRRAQELAGPEDMIFVGGSTFVVAEVLMTCEQGA